MSKRKLKHANFKLPVEIVAGIKIVQDRDGCANLTAATIRVLKTGLDTLGVPRTSIEDGAA